MYVPIFSLCLRKRLNLDPDPNSGPGLYKDLHEIHADPKIVFETEVIIVDFPSLYKDLHEIHADPKIVFETEVIIVDFPSLILHDFRPPWSWSHFFFMTSVLFGAGVTYSS